MAYEMMGGERDTAAVARLIAHAFGGTREACSEWIAKAGFEHERVLREAETPVACLLRIPMGQYFGGRRVGMLGIAGVAVAPEARGRGHALRLMQESMREARRDGFPISCLYASTQTLYRKVGFEQAGHRFLTRVPLSQIDVRERTGTMMPVAEAERAGVAACYDTFAPRFNGMLDRGPYCWGRVENFRDEQYAGFAVPAPSSAGGCPVDGYVYLTQRRKPDTGRHDVVLTDLAFRTAAAGRRILGFLADFATVGDDLVFPGPPHHPILGLLGQQRYTVILKDYWMLRLVDVAAALEARGYNAGVAAEVHLDVRDDLIPENNRKMVLRVEAGKGTVREGGRGDLTTDVRSLAAAYTGFVSPRALGLMGQFEGDERSIDALGSAFGGGTPWMTDYF